MAQLLCYNTLMKITKREASDIQKEEAHGGAGARRVYANKGHVKAASFEAMTHGYLPAGKSFDWHEHVDTEEIVVIVKGSGIIADKDGEYDYAPGDVFIFPANIQHKVINNSDEDHEMIFVRVEL